MKSEPKKLKLDDLVLSSALCPRAELSTQHTMALGEAVLRGCVLPPLKVMHTRDGRLLLYGGYHTYRALRMLEEKEALCEVTEGTFDDAVWLSCLENKLHGRPRSRLDTHMVVKRALAHPNAAAMSWGELSDALNVPQAVIMYIARNSRPCRVEDVRPADASGKDAVGEIRLYVEKLRRAIDDVVSGSAKAPGANLAHAKVFQKLLTAMKEEVERWGVAYGDKPTRVSDQGDREDT